MNPHMVLSQLKAEYASWRVQDVSDLSPSARRSWDYKKYAKPSECPGIAIGAFENANQSHAVLLVPRTRADSGYRLLVFSRKTSRPTYQLTVLEQSDDVGARDVFIRKVRISDFFNKQSQKQLSIGVNEGILIVESGEQQFGADIFFWTREGYRHKPTEY